MNYEFTFRIEAYPKHLAWRAKPLLCVKRIVVASNEVTARRLIFDELHEKRKFVRRIYLTEKSPIV